MKKNTMMRLASALLVLVMLTTCAISGTFAKYVSSATATDNARIAYWGWDADATIDFDLFDATYGETVNSEDGDNVVAPGTEKSETFAFAYTDNVNDAIEAPEVDYTFAVAFDVTGETTEWDKNVNFVWTLDGTEYQTVAELKDAVLALSGEADGSADYDANELPDGFGVGDDHTIGWKWAYSVDEAGDKADTALGNMDPLDYVTFKITITATQID